MKSKRTGSLLRKVSVIGIGETKIGKFPERSLKDLITEAGSQAIQDAGISKNDIEILYMGNYNANLWSGQTQIGALASEALGLGRIPNIRIEAACASGSLAFRQAYLGVAAGLYDVALVGGVEKMTHADTAAITTGVASATDVEVEARNGLTFPGIFAMIANRYMYEYGLTRAELAEVSIQSHKNAMFNPHAQMHKELTVEKVITGFPVADPLTVYDCSLVSDGAAFAVLCAADQIGEYSRSQKAPIEIIGSGHGGDTLSIYGKKIITSFEATKSAAAEAFQMAGITPADIDLAEVHDCFSITQLIDTEDLGFFPCGKGVHGLLSGETAIGGRIPINTSGGLKAKGHPIGATGLCQIFEVVTQLRGDAGGRQVKEARIGLTHNLGGSGAVGAVHIFQRGEH